MPSSLTSAMEIEARDFTHRIHPVVEMTLGGTVYRFAEYPVCSEAKGVYLPYVEQLGDKKRSANISEFSIETPTLRFTINDHDRVLQKLFGGPLKGKVRNSPVEVWWRSLGGQDNEIALADHYRDFAGVILDYGKSTSGRVFEFSAAADVSGLDAAVKIPAWSREDWPNAPEETIGSPGRVIYGSHISSSIAESFGMIKAVPLKVEANATKDVDIWGVSIGKNFNIPRIFIGETLSTSSFTVGSAVRGKNYSQILTYTAGGTHPTKDSDIKCDVEGLTTLPDGSGTLIANPAAQIRHALNVFGYGTGDARPFVSWPSESGSPIASAILDAAAEFFHQRNWSGSMVIRTGQTLRNVLDTWCRSFNAAPFFSDTWGIGARPRVNGDTILYYDDRHAAQRLHRAKDLGFTTDRQDPITDLAVNYLLDEARGAFARYQLVAWRRSGVEVVERDFDQTYGKRSAI